MARGRLIKGLAALCGKDMLLAGILLALGCGAPQIHEQLDSVPSAGSEETPFVSLRKPVAPVNGEEIQQVQYVEEAPPASADERPSLEPMPIDLASALRLAGANNLQVVIAGERVRQAQARLQGAEHQWLPSLNAGVGYNLHGGRVQDTRGEVLDTNRSALFVGGGPNLGPAPLTGPAGPPARLFLGLPLSDLLFAPLAERQLVQAANTARAATFNDMLLQVALAYLDLVHAQGQAAVAEESVKNAQELLRLVDSRVRAGTAPPADGLRARAERADRQRQRFQAEEAVRVASAELVRLVRLDPAVILFPMEGEPAPVCLVDVNAPLPDLLAQGIASRPELAEHQALIQATLERLKQEHWRPWLPTMQVGLSAGGFGGGEGAFFGRFGDRTDFDALMVWELRNLGFGNQALKRDRASQHLQAQLTAEQLRDTIASQIARAYYQVQFRERQIEASRSQVQSAAEAVPLNFKGILGGDLRAIEAQQAVATLAFARSQYLTSVIDYNRAQFQLLRALGKAPDTELGDSKP